MVADAWQKKAQVDVKFTIKVSHLVFNIKLSLRGVQYFQDVRNLQKYFGFEQLKFRRFYVFTVVMLATDVTQNSKNGVQNDFEVLELILF